MTRSGDHIDLAEFVEFLIARESLTEHTAQRVLSAVDASGEPIDSVLTELGLMREELFAKEAANFLSADYVSDPAQIADQDAAELLGNSFLLSNAIVPLRGGEDRLRVAVANPFKHSGLAMLEYQAERPLHICISGRSTINAALESLRKQAPETVGSGSELAPFESDLERLRDFAQQAPIVKLVTKITQLAFDEGATDIHFEPFETHLRIRLRIDGDLRPVDVVPIDLLPGISTRIKILAGLDISERRLPQDGRMRTAVRGQNLDLRVSVVPTIHGETIVLRVLDRSTVALELASLGFAEDARISLKRLAEIPNGIVLVTGPTGSGKTTTLYALVSTISRPEVKVFTVEDPVEYRLDGVTQVQISTATGLTFQRALRSVLRQDPDVILVGEIRDRETAEIAMQAALTGHLVLATLHTNSAVGAVTRLRDMGIESYLIGATLKGVLSQRLLRKLCICHHTATKNCAVCQGSGFKGRTVTYEIAEIQPSVASNISAGADEASLERDLIGQGLVPLSNHAASLVHGAVTTEGEVARAVSLTSKASP